MTCEIKQKICDNIFKYITEELREWIDTEIFTKISLERLGEFYYRHILSVIENSSEDLLNAVIRKLLPRSIECECLEDYYRGLCKYLGINKLPSDTLSDIQREYSEIFVTKYNTVLQKYQVTIDAIRNKLYQLKVQSYAIKNAPPSHSLMRDISTDEQKLYELYLECNELRTRKEMLDFAVEYMKSKLAKFCDMQDTRRIEEAKMREALKLSKEDSYGADFVFSSYRDYVEIVEDDIDRPYVLFFKVKIYVVIENARKNYCYSTYTKSNNESIEEYKNYISLIPKIDDLYSFKRNNPSSYNSALEKLIGDYGIIGELKTKLESSVCLRERKSILLKAVELYEQGEFEVFNNVLPIQIEGMFADYLQDATTFLRFSKMDIYINDVLKDKITHLQEVKSDIYP